MFAELIFFMHSIITAVMRLAVLFMSISYNISNYIIKETKKNLVRLDKRISNEN